ncbi:DUF6191 domain-containing protein [Kitasatospora purpeofusca]|uniref:DUF6191 domain-containing protein n=1 Tax=Kitasatospora purpeofusca TaxID=67352 RepID=UPI0035D9AB4B
MGSLVFPAVLVVLFFVASAGRQAVLRTPRLRWLARRLRPSHESGERGTGATATEELHALLYPSKRVQLEQRRIELVLRDDENDGAPPPGPASTSLPAPQPSAELRARALEARPPSSHNVGNYVTAGLGNSVTVHSPCSGNDFSSSRPAAKTNVTTYLSASRSPCLNQFRPLAPTTG